MTFNLESGYFIAQADSLPKMRNIRHANILQYIKRAASANKRSFDEREERQNFYHYKNSIITMVIALPVLAMRAENKSFCFDTIWLRVLRLANQPD